MQSDPANCMLELSDKTQPSLVDISNADTVLLQGGE